MEMDFENDSDIGLLKIINQPQLGILKPLK